MNGHQQKKPNGTNAPSQIKVPTMPTVKPPTIKPVEKGLDIAAVAEQLNGLLDRYNTIYDLYSKLEHARIVNERAEMLKRVLDNIEKAIDALCLRICESQFILETNQGAT